MYKAVGRQTNKVIETAPTKAELLRKVSMKYPSNEKVNRSDGKKELAMMPEAFWIEKH